MSIPGPNPGATPDGPARGERFDDARLDALLDAFFDKELTVDESSSLFKGLRTNPAKAREFAATRQALESLRTPEPAPDLADEILSKVHAQRPWLRDRDVWGVRIGRAGLVAALLLALGGVLYQRSLTPDAAIWNPAPAPVTDLVRTSGEATSLTRESAQAAMVSLRTEAVRFVPQRIETQPQAAGLASFKPGASDPAASADQATFAVSRKPCGEGDRERRVRFYAAGASQRPEGDWILLRLTPGDEPGEGGSTLVTFRPR